MGSIPGWGTKIDPAYCKAWPGEKKKKKVNWADGEARLKGYEQI